MPARTSPDGSGEGNGVRGDGNPYGNAAAADGRTVLHSKFLAVIVGVLSLALGLWTVLAGIPALGMAAGILGLVAGLIALVPTPAGAPAGPAVVATAPTGQGRHTDRVDLSDGAAPLSAATTGDGPDVVGASFPSTTGPSGTGPSTTGPSADGSPELLTDPDTDLFSEAYLRVALDSRLASARRHLRPVAVAIIEVTEGMPDDNAMAAPAARVADAIRETVREADIACRMDDGTFAVILEDTPENGAVWTVERIRRNLVSRFGHHTLWAGVACYPAHAFDGEELLKQVRAALVSAKEWKQDRIEVAAAE
jgi:diguanylate cyclase (GGDEF)-like protein